MSDFSYFNIHLETCLVKAPTYGSLALYVEQASSDDLGNPYRQRLYVITTEGESVRSEIWAPLLDFQWVGTCQKDEVVEVDAGDFSLREGCDVWLTQTEDGFEGATDGKGCSSSLGGASYATSQVTLTEDLLQSWDRLQLQ